MKAFKELGIEIILEVGSWGDGQNFASVAADKQKKSEFIGFLHDAIKYFSADGVCIKWTWPGCPQVNNLSYNGTLEVSPRGFIAFHCETHFSK
jgi:GH18 family chitinase